MGYIHERPDWPKFYWSAERLGERLAEVRYRQGLLLGKMRSLGFDARTEVSVETLTTDIVRSSTIEGENLNYEQVRSSIAHSLGIETAALPPSDRHIEGIVEMALDATTQYDKPLTAERLCAWHAALFPDGRSGLRRIAVGRWRTPDSDPMQVISGGFGRERIHFEAPPAIKIPVEIERFIDWFEASADTDLLLRAGIAHLWFVTIHPFEDGNGRIARAVADMALARAEESRERFYSMSSQIAHERKTYYEILESTQHGGMDITRWLEWFVACLGRALEGAEAAANAVLRRARIWNEIGGHPMNDRQRLIIGRLLNDFQGKLTSSRYAKIARCSPDSALRDLQELIAFGILKKGMQGGRSTSYELDERLC